MGNWCITVHGVGSHHNTGNPHDANRMAAHFVRALRDAGHNVTHASFTFGGEEQIVQPERYIDDRNAIECLDRRPRCPEKLGGAPCRLVVDHEGGHEVEVRWVSLKEDVTG